MTNDLVSLHICIDHIVGCINLNFLDALYLKQRSRLIETSFIKTGVNVISSLIRPLVFMLRFGHTLQLQASWPSFLTNGRRILIKLSVGRRVHRAGV